MDIQKILDRVKAIIFQPEQEWPVIRTEPITNKDLVLTYVLPFAVIAAVIGWLSLWISTFFGFGVALRYGVMQLVMPLIAVVVASVVINELAETFDSEKNLNNAFKLVVFSYIPALLANIVASLAWTLGWVSLFGLYGAYLLWLGFPVMMKTPENKRLFYIIAAIVIIFIVNLIIGAILSINRLGY